MIGACIRRSGFRPTPKVGCLGVKVSVATPVEVQWRVWSVEGEVLVLH